MIADLRAKVIGERSRVRVLAKSANMQPRNLSRVQLHQKAIAISLNDLRAPELCLALK